MSVSLPVNYSLSFINRIGYGCLQRIENLDDLQVLPEECMLLLLGCLLHDEVWNVWSSLAIIGACPLICYGSAFYLFLQASFSSSRVLDLKVFFLCLLQTLVAWDSRYFNHHHSSVITPAGVSNDFNADYIYWTHCEVTAFLVLKQAGLNNFKSLIVLGVQKYEYLTYFDFIWAGGFGLEIKKPLS